MVTGNVTTFAHFIAANDDDDGDDDSGEDNRSVCLRIQTYKGVIMHT